MNRKVTVELSWQNIALITGGALLIFFMWKLQNIVFMVMLAFIINSSLRPFIDKLESKKVPRMLSIIIIYMLVGVLVIVGIITVFAQLIEQFTTLLAQAPEIITNFGILFADTLAGVSNALNRVPGVDTSLDAAFIQEQIKVYIDNLDFNVFSGGVSHAVNILNSTFGVFMQILTVLILSIYMLIKKEDIYASLVMFLSKPQAKKYSKLVKKIEDQLGRWLRGQLSLMGIVSIMTWIGLVIPSLFIDDYNLHKFAILFAVIAGLLEIIPTLGPIIATVIAVVLAAGFNLTAPLLPVLYIGALFTFIQQVEAAYLVPKVMQKAVGLDPVVTIAAFYAALNIFDILGVVLIIPILAVVNIIIKFELRENNILGGSDKDDVAVDVT